MFLSLEAGPPSLTQGHLSLIPSALPSRRFWLLMGTHHYPSVSSGESGHLPQDVLSHWLTCPGGLVGDHKGLALGVVLTDVHGLGQAEHREEAASVVVGWPASVVLLGDSTVGEALVLCGLEMELK